MNVQDINNGHHVGEYIDKNEVSSAVFNPQLLVGFSRHKKDIDMNNTIQYQSMGNNANNNQAYYQHIGINPLLGRPREPTKRF